MQHHHLQRDHHKNWDLDEAYQHLIEVMDSTKHPISSQMNQVLKHYSVKEGILENN